MKYIILNGIGQITQTDELTLEINKLFDDGELEILRQDSSQDGNPEFLMLADYENSIPGDIKWMNIPNYNFEYEHLNTSEDEVQNETSEPSHGEGEE